MSNKKLTLLAVILLMTSCENKAQKQPKVENNTGMIIQKTSVSASEIKKILDTKTTRYKSVADGYEFMLPFNFNINPVSMENTKTHSFRMAWEVRPDFIIDSNDAGFKRFALDNFVPFIPFSQDSGELYIFKDKNIPNLKIEDFLKNFRNVIYKDENSAIVNVDGKLRAFCFHYLPEGKEYALFESDSPFWNIQPNISEAQEINQLAHHLRLAKNIFKPIASQAKDWDSYNGQLSVLESEFYKKINDEAVKAFQSDANLKSYFPSDKGNNVYYAVFRANAEMDKIWSKMNSVPKNGKVTVGDNDFSYLRDENFRYFYSSDYELVDKSEKSLTFRRASSHSFCLVSKSKSGHFYVLKEFPELQFMEDDFYNEEISFYKSLFENSF